MLLDKQHFAGVHSKIPAEFGITWSMTAFSVLAEAEWQKAHVSCRHSGVSQEATKTALPGCPDAAFHAYLPTRVSYNTGSPYRVRCDTSANAAEAEQKQLKEGHVGTMDRGPLDRGRGPWTRAGLGKVVNVKAS
jgi:hypothetical protein